MELPTFTQLLKKPAWLVAFGFGSGLVPVAPGTAGTVAALPLYLLLAQLPPWGYAAAVLAAGVIGVFICDRVATEMGVHDHGAIVWDEFVGLWITLFLAPEGWQWMLLGFVLFRALDILKPWPIRWLDREVKGGIGIMLDDVLAGIMAALCIQALVILLA